MAVAYLNDGATSLAAGNWTDTIGFANSATLVVDRGGATAFTNTDWSALTQGIDYFKVLPTFSGALQTASGGPLKFDADQGTDQLVSMGGSGLLRYQAAGNSNACTNVENIGSGQLYLQGGTFTAANLCNGSTWVDSSSVVTSAYVTGGNNVIDYNATALTTFEQTGGYTVLRRLANAIVLNGGTLVLDFDDGAATIGTFGSTSVTINGGTLIWKNGNISNVVWRSGTVIARDLRRSATFGGTSFVLYAGVNGYLKQPATGSTVTWATATKRGSAAGFATQFGD